MIASNRQGRPQMPKDYCPFCPSFGNVPDYEVLEYDNDFPALSQNPPEPDEGIANDFFKVKPSYGKCEVILYSPGHTVTMPELSYDHMKKLVDLWCERFNVMRSDEKIKYVFPFENRGEVVGVTMPHPHGQMYGYSFIPKKLQLETASAKEYYEKTGNCLFCDTLKNELEAQKRIIFQNEHFTVYLPSIASILTVFTSWQTAMCSISPTIDRRGEVHPGRHHPRHRPGCLTACLTIASRT